MEESELREQIQQKISEGTLPRDPSIFSTFPVNSMVREARGEPCSVCDLPIHPPDAISEFRSHIHPNMRFFFHPACEQFWREEANRFVHPRTDPPVA
jgi:hypothetical protein